MGIAVKSDTQVATGGSGKEGGSTKIENCKSTALRFVHFCLYPVNHRISAQGANFRRRGGRLYEGGL